MPRVLAQALIEVSTLLGVYLREELFPAHGKLLCLTLRPQKVEAFSQPVFLPLQGKNSVNQSSVLSMIIPEMIHHLELIRNSAVKWSLSHQQENMEGPPGPPRAGGILCIPRSSSIQLEFKPRSHQHTKCLVPDEAMKPFPPHLEPLSLLTPYTRLPGERDP